MFGFKCPSYTNTDLNSLPGLGSNRLVFLVFRTAHARSCYPLIQEVAPVMYGIDRFSHSGGLANIIYGGYRRRMQQGFPHATL